MSEFKRENRYWVLKLSDLEHIPYQQQNALIRLCNSVASSRLERGKPSLECVVIESDWPIYEEVWDMVQRLAENRDQKVAGLQARIARLECVTVEAMELINDCINLSRSTGEWHHKADLQQMTEQLVQHRQKLSDALNKNAQERKSENANHDNRPD